MEITGPTLDAADPAGLARFYSRLLGWPIVAAEGPRPGYPPEDGWAKIRDPSNRLKMEFQWDERYTRPVWPSAAGAQQMMMHLDIAVDDLGEGVAWGPPGRRGAGAAPATGGRPGAPRPGGPPLLPLRVAPRSGGH